MTCSEGVLGSDSIVESNFRDIDQSVIAICYLS